MAAGMSRAAMRVTRADFGVIASVLHAPRLRGSCSPACRARNVERIVAKWKAAPYRPDFSLCVDQGYVPHCRVVLTLVIRSAAHDMSRCEGDCVAAHLEGTAKLRSLQLEDVAALA
jgi:hypothetical protein